MEQTSDKLNFDQIDFGLIFKDILREWWVIAILTISVGLVTHVYFSLTYQPEYITSSTFAVTTRGMNVTVYQNLSNAQEVAGRFSQVLDSSLLKKKVSEELGIDSFDAETTAEVVEETNLITLTVKADSALKAYRGIRSIMDNYDTVSDYVIENVMMEVLQEPTIPMSPINSPNTREPVRKAMMLTALIAAVYFAIFSYIRDTIKSENDVRRKLAARLIGSIYHEKKGIRKKKDTVHQSMLITNPLLSFRYVESCRMTASRLRSRMDHRDAKVLMLTSVAENEGKSTVAANMAISLAEEGKKVLLIDCDFRKPSQYKIFDVPKDEVRDLTEEFNKGEGIGEVIKRWGGSSLYLSLNRKAVPSMEVLSRSGTFEKYLEFARSKMDYVIMDTSPMAMVADTEELAQMADCSALVVREDWILSKDINDRIDILNQTNAEVIGVIYNDAASRSTGRSVHGYGSGYGSNYAYGRYSYGGRHG